MTDDCVVSGQERALLLVCLRVDVDIKVYPSASLHIIITLMCVCSCVGCTYVCGYMCAHVGKCMKR